MSFWISSENLNEENKLQIINLFSEELNQPKSKYNKILETKSDYIVIEKDIILNDYKELVNKSKNINFLRLDLYNHRYISYERGAQLIGFTNNDNVGRYELKVTLIIF